MDWRTSVTRLSKMRDITDIPRGRPLTWLDNHCFMRSARFTAEMVLDAKALLIGPQACLNAMQRTRRNQERKVVNVGAIPYLQENYYTLVTGQEGAAFGDDDRIVASIRRIIVEDAPPVLVVVTTCMHEVLGLDVESLLASLGDTGPTRVFSLKVDTFSGRNTTTVRDQLTSQFIDLVDPPRRTDPGRVNVLGWSFSSSGGEIVDVLGEAGFDRVVTFPAREASLEDFRSAAEAARTLVVEEACHTLGSELRDRFGSHVVHAPRPLGLEATRRWYEDVSEGLGVRLPYEGRYEAARAAAEQLRDRVRGLRFAVESHWGSAQVAVFLAELGMEPVALVYEDDPEPWEQGAMDLLRERGCDPWVSRPNRLGLKRLFREDRPDILIGLPDLEIELGVPNIPLRGFTLAYFQATEYLMDVLGLYAPQAPDGARDREVS